MRWQQLQLFNSTPPVLLQQCWLNLRHICIILSMILFCLILYWVQEQWLGQQHLQLHHPLLCNQQGHNTQLLQFIFYPALTTIFIPHLHPFSLPQNLKTQRFHRWPAHLIQTTIVVTILIHTTTPSTSHFTLWYHSLWPPPPPQVLQPLAQLGPLWYPISSVWWRIWLSSCLLLTLDLSRSEVSACICVGKKFCGILFLVLPVTLLKNTLTPPGTRFYKKTQLLLVMCNSYSLLWKGTLLLIRARPYSYIYSGHCFVCLTWLCFRCGKTH